MKKYLLTLGLVVSIGQAASALELNQEMVELPNSGFKSSEGGTVTTVVRKIDDKENNVVCYVTYNRLSGGSLTDRQTLVTANPQTVCLKK